MNAALHHLSSRKRIRGSVLINTAIALSLVVITLLGTQLGYLFFIKRELQKTADLAALSGAQSLQPFVCTDAKTAAVTNASQNMPPLLPALTQGDVECGNWDRNPTSLHPEAPEAVGRAVAEAITDKRGVIARACGLAKEGRWQLALHVIDLLAIAEGDAPEIVEARSLKAEWLRERARQVPSYVSRNLYRVGADMIEQGTQARFGIH